jgi:1-deoxy-D-xylulose-5-phosphate reductoisomerase
MKLPIALGMAWPDRLGNVSQAVDWSKAHSWVFEPLDESVFGSVALARQVGIAGLTYPAVYNAANEQAVEAFHDGKIKFTGIFDVIQEVVQQHTASHPLTLDSVLDAELWARKTADLLIAKH